jgi:hypothetical protein
VLRHDATAVQAIDWDDWQTMNDESLTRVNAFLEAVAAKVEVGGILDETPAEIGRELGFPDPLSTARAVRALIARKRLEATGGSYRLLDATPVTAEEREAIGRRPRAARGEGATRGGRRRPRDEGVDPDALAYSDLGRAAVDKLVELGQDVSRLRAELRSAREELREAKSAKDEAERRARTLGERTASLEHRAEMAEANLRSLLAAAKGREQKPDAPVGDTEMAAILGVLRGDEAPAAAAASEAPAPDEAPAAE